jgi:cytochrome o ubiquinol oxidase subunit 2
MRLDAKADPPRCPRVARRAQIRVLVAALACAALAGCGGVLTPRGPVAASEKLILIDSMAVMLVLVVPTVLAAFAIAWWFRASNTRAKYRPDWAFSGQLELLVWAVPTLDIIFLGGIAWFGSHALDPYKPLPSPRPAVQVEVVSLDWKWLFIYPDEGVATVNRLVIPVGTPVHFRLTSAGVMNSFFVPQLGSQIYTMAKMTSQLSLKADKPGTYMGISAQFSGAGFAGMRFDVEAVSPAAYAAWLAATRSHGPILDPGAYAALVKPSQDVAPMSYGAVTPHLFETIAGGPVDSLAARSGPARLTAPRAAEGD